MERPQGHVGEDVIVRMDDFGYDLQRLDRANSSTGRQLTRSRRMNILLIDDNGFPSVAGDVRRTQSQIRDMLRGFERFVNLLSRQPISRRIRSLYFRYVLFEPFDWRWFRNEDIERLFSEVLPALLPTLEVLQFNICDLPDDYLSSFLSRLPVLSASAATALTELDIFDCYVHTETCAPLVAEVIRSNHVPIQVLKFRPVPKMGKDACQLIFSSVPHNQRLRSLEVGVVQVFEDGPILPPLDPSSSALRVLRMNVRTWTDEGKASLARQLRTNTALEELHVKFENNVSLPHGPWVELLETHNFTLLDLSDESIRAPPLRAVATREGRVAAGLRRNSRIQQALAQLVSYRVAPPALVPCVWELVGGHPTLLYRFLRRGDASALADRLLPPPPPQQHRSSGDEDDSRETKRSRTA